MPIDNHRGIFADKKAFVLAKKYNLELNDKRGYITESKYVTYSDVKFIVKNLWIDHFMYNVKQPCEVEPYIYTRYYLEFMDTTTVF